MAGADPETLRIRDIHNDASGWRRWGPYLSDRSWGTVREDYSANGDAWRFLPYDLARSKAYRWGEDVKECYYQVDNTPTHSHTSLLYRYPQRAFPYAELVTENRRREHRGAEYELTDTGIFDDGRYFDILVEYAKRSPEEIAIRITATNRGGEPAELHLVPTLWFRNTWAWDGRGAVPPDRLDGACRESHRRVA